jgi:plastocyanin
MCKRRITLRLLTLLFLWTALPAPATSSAVTGQVTIADASGAKRAGRDVSVVFWLTPLASGDQASARADGKLPHPALVQKNKVFTPHVLAVQVGSQIDFPNRDPFFHNVFSLFNGQRFDLGLYEAGSTRGVHFNRAGVCYIFCNIHPQMSAVVVVVDTPYFAVSDSRGEVVMPNVPPGPYQLRLWEEHCAPKTLDALSRQITLSENATSLGNIHIQETDQPASAHLNKYGKPYDPEVFSSPAYLKP